MSEANDRLVRVLTPSLKTIKIMKTKLQKLFLTLLTLAASSQKLGVNLIRVAILLYG